MRKGKQKSKKIMAPPEYAKSPVFIDVYNSSNYISESYCSLAKVAVTRLVIIV